VLIVVVYFNNPGMLKGGPGQAEPVSNSITEKSGKPKKPGNLRIFPGETKIINGKKTIHGNIIIEPGGKLIVTGTITFGWTSEIIVKQNAKLVLDGGTLTTPDRKWWNGIEVWGTRSKSQFISHGYCFQGTIEVKNGGIIENAVNAIRLWHPGDYSSSGGIVLATNACFRNNQKAIEFISYHNFNEKNQKPCENRCRIVNCSFQTDDQYPGRRLFKAFITMWEIEGIEISGCSFSNTAQEQEPEQRGFGIFTFNAQLRVTSSPSTQYSGFDGLSAGIYFLGHKNSGRIVIENSNFFNNSCGIRLINTDSCVIRNNSIEIGENHLCTGSPGTGMDLIACRAISIDDNSFCQLDNSGRRDFSIGLRTVGLFNYNNSFDELKSNRFEKVNVAIQSEELTADHINTLLQSLPASFFNSSDSGSFALKTITKPDIGITSDGGIEVYPREEMEMIRVYGDFASDRCALAENFEPAGNIHSRFKNLQDSLKFSPFAENKILSDLEGSGNTAITINRRNVVTVPAINNTPALLTNAEMTERSYTKLLTSLQQALIKRKRTIFQFESWEIKKLRSIAVKSTGISGIEAKCILSFCYWTDYLDCPQLLIPGSDNNQNPEP